MVGIDAWTEFWGRQTPTAPALLTPAGPVGWGALDERVRLRAADLADGTVVDIASRSAGDAVEVLLACARVGALADATGDGSPARRTGTGLGTPLLRLPAELTPGGVVELTHHDVEALAVAGIAADGLWPADRVAAAGPLPAWLVAVLPALHAGASVATGADPGGVTVAHGHVPVAGPDLRTIVVREPDQVAAPGVAVVVAYGPAEASGFALRQPMPGAPLVALPGRRARVVDGELWLSGAGVVTGDAWLRTGRPAVVDGAGFRLPTPVGSA